MAASERGVSAVVEEQQAQAPLDGVLIRIGQAIMLHRAGDREEARNRLSALWHEVGPDGDAFHRCALAHYMADTQDDPRDELHWDLRALDAAEGSVTEGAEETDTGALRAFFPSLHLNLAADYLALSRPADARSQLLRARAATNGLADGEYRQGLREAIDRLAVRLDGEGGAGT